MNIEQRLARLERENRFLKGCAVAGLVSLGCVALLAADVDAPKEITADLITAKVFRMEDGSGPRGKWYVDRKKGPILSLEWNRGKDKAEVRKRSISSSDTLWFCSNSPATGADTWLSVDSSSVQFFNHGKLKKSLFTYGDFSTSD